MLRPEAKSALAEDELKLSCEEEEEGAGRRFHFDQESGECVEVDYLGCFGTGNLFETRERCQEVCGEFDREDPEIDVRRDSLAGKGKEEEDVDICELPPYEEDAFPCRARKRM